MNYMKMFLVSIFLITLIGCGGGGGGGKELPPDTHTVTYDVSNSQSQNALITYIDADGKTVTLPSENCYLEDWTFTFTAKNGSHLALSAQLLGSTPDTVYVTIYLDTTNKVAEKSSYFEYAFASTSYDIPLN